MHCKIIQPGKHGRLAYDNKGSCGGLIEYLGHEAKSNKVAPLFFDQAKENIADGEVRAAIDGNVKGLRKGEVKFYSLVISPSPYELKHIKENHHKPHSVSIEDSLRLFTKKVMENYAQGFNLKNERKLSLSDLQWYAIIHHERQYKGSHQEVVNGEAKRGALKEGLNAHVHIIVSKRDRSQKINLNPQSAKERFYIKGWQKENEESFDRIFSYNREVKSGIDLPVKLTEEQKERLHLRIQDKLSIINPMLCEGERLPQKAVEQIAQKKGYKEVFFYNLNRLESNLRQGQPVYEPLHLLEHNKDRVQGIDKSSERKESCKLGAQIEHAFKVLSGEKLGMDDDLSLSHAKPRFRRQAYTFNEQQKTRNGTTRGM
jgi:hypothetical protein